MIQNSNPLDFNNCQNMLKAALAYARNGWPVFPCRLTKQPWTQHGFKDPTTDEGKIREWWGRYPNASIGVPTGHAIGAWVLDVDLPDGPESLDEIESQHGPLAITLEQVTGSGGRHLFFAEIPGDKIQNSAKIIGQGLDVRGDGGYVIVAPSSHPSGNRYQWKTPSRNGEGETCGGMIMPPPPWLLDLVKHEKPPVKKAIHKMGRKQTRTNPAALHPYIQSALKNEIEKVAHAPEGTRNTTLNNAALKLGHYVGSGELDQQTVEDELLAAALRAGLCESEAKKTIESGIRKGKSEPKQVPTSQSENKLTCYERPSSEKNIVISSDVILRSAAEQEQGAASLFKAMFKEKIVYDHAERQWYVYFNNFWLRDKVEQANALVDYVQNLFKTEFDNNNRNMLSLKPGQSTSEVDSNQDLEFEAKMRKLKRHKVILSKAIKLLQKKYNRDQVIILAAQGEGSLGIGGDEWDHAVDVLPCKNGIVNLKTGTLRPGKPSDYIRTAAPVEYNPTATCPEFETALFAIMGGDKEMVSFLQRLFGYAIAGNPTEQVFPIMVGSGGNGKSIIIESIAYALGDLAWAVRAEFFLENGRFGSADTPSASIQSLRGRRFVYGSEPSEDRSFDVAKVKLFTGGDRLTCRAPYSKHEITFSPTHVPFLLANNKPCASASDDAFWRRALVIEFPMSFVDNPTKPNELKRDRLLLSKLKNEAQGIIRWVVDGYREWQENGLNVPEKIKAALLAYRKDTDIVLQFIEERYIYDATNEEEFYGIYKNYLTWAQDRRLQKPWSKKKLGQNLARHFKKRYNSDKNTMYIGIKAIG